MEINECGFSINICTDSEKDLSLSKDVAELKKEKTPKIGKLLCKESARKILRAGATVQKSETRKKQTVKVSRKGLRGFKVSDQGAIDEEGEINKTVIQHGLGILDNLNVLEEKPAVPLFTNSHFDSLNLHPHMVANLLQNLGIEKLTTVQKLAIPVISSGCDALIRSQTGSGKTIAYAVPIIEALHAIRPKIKRSDGVLAVIVVPTRELALQTYEWFLKLLKPYTWIVPGYLAGGEKRKSEKARLRRGVNVLVSTPGRLVDHVCHTRNLQLQRVKYLVLDEADRMLDLGYEKDVSSIVSSLDECQSKVRFIKWETDNNDNDSGVDANQEPRRQTILLSATLTKEVYKLAGLILREPSKIDASGGDVEEDSFVVPQNIAQWYMLVPPKLRLVVLAAFIIWKCKMTEGKKMLVFCATQDMVDYLTELLTQVLGTAASTLSEKGDVLVEEEGGEGVVDVEFFKLHGNMNQKDRVDVFKSFRDIEAGVLLCTDVASRGLDLPRVDWVLQWTAPPTPTDYVHRVGRTARGGSRGAALLFLAPTEAPFLADLFKKGIRLKEETLDRCLQNLLAAGISTGILQGHETRSAESASTAVQLRFEDAVLGRPALHQLGCKAFTSFVRFYAAYPKECRSAFNVRRLHLGHYAKGFALRDPPSAIGVTAGRVSREGEALRRPGEKRSSAPSPRMGPQAATKRRRALSWGNESRSRMLVTSEYASGLEGTKKKKKRRH